MAIYSGKDGVIKVATPGATPTFQTVGEVKDWSIEQTGNTVQANSMDTTWARTFPTTKSWSASISALFDDEANSQGLLQVGDDLLLEVYTAGVTTPTTKFSGTVIVTSVSHSASFDGMTEVSFAATGDGALTVVVTPAA